MGRWRAVSCHAWGGAQRYGAWRGRSERDMAGPPVCGVAAHLARQGQQLRGVCARNVDQLLRRRLSRAVIVACGVQDIGYELRGPGSHITPPKQRARPETRSLSSNCSSFCSRVADIVLSSTDGAGLQPGPDHRAPANNAMVRLRRLHRRVAELEAVQVGAQGRRRCAAIDRAWRRRQAACRPLARCLQTAHNFVAPTWSSAPT